MDEASQLKLVKVDKLVKEKAQPQPHVKNYREIKKYEILHRPFDLKFRGRINKWLSDSVDYEKALDEDQQKLIKLYFFPQGRENVWLSQKDVVKKISSFKLWKIRSSLVDILYIVWEGEHG